MNRRSLAAITALTASLTVFGTEVHAQVQGIGSTTSGDFFPIGASADGSLVAGSIISPGLRSKVGVWSEASGLRILDETALEDFFAFDMSDDGNVIAGVEVRAQVRTGAIWDAATGLRVEVPPLAGDTSSDALWVSGDGSTVVGTSRGTRFRIFRWTHAAGTQEIPLPPNEFSRVSGVSQDGSAVVGSYRLPGGQNRAFRWTPSTGAQPIPGLGDHASYATGVSDDGQVIVGSTNTPGFTSRLFYYRVGSAAVEVLPGITTASPSSVRVSADGSTVIGSSANFPSGQTGFAWTPSLGHVVVGAGLRTIPISVSADGGIICGIAYPLSGGQEQRAFRWDDDGVTLLTLLEGIAPSEFSSAFAVSADGSTVVGHTRLSSGEVRGAIWRASGALGASVCDPAVVNSTGVPGRLVLRGTNAIARADLVLRAVDLPPGVTTTFLVSLSAMAPLPVLGSQGLSCLGGTSGRFFAPEQLRTTGADGVAELLVDVTKLPFPVLPVAPGESLYFQAWHRDSNPAATSNFTSAATVRVF